MTEPHQSPAGIDPRTRMGPVTLRVSDLDRVGGFYATAVGLVEIERAPGTATLGTPDGTPLLHLVEDRAAASAPSNAAGLFHTAFLLPSRKELARWLRHVAGMDLNVGAGDHLVSEAFYLNDPDGNGIEVYADRPRSTWQVEGKAIAMDTLAVDVHGILRELEAGAEPWEGVPNGTTVGHVHLRVSDIPQARAFYEGIVGFDVVNESYPSALFVSAGGYHHHLGLNVWQSRGGPHARRGTLGLESVAVLLPDAAALAALGERLRSAGYEVHARNGKIVTHDPSGIVLAFAAEPSA
jgi:catechol 2,3-dioxygenase